MEQQLDAFTQKRFELMVEMATKKLQQEIDSLKLAFNSLNGELNSMKSQVSRMQFQARRRKKSGIRKRLCKELRADKAEIRGLQVGRCQH